MLYLPLPLEPYTDVLNFDPSIFNKYSVLKKRKTKNDAGNPRKNDLLDCVCAFDIETTNIEEIEHAVMYIWQFQIDTELTVFGRTWEEFKALLLLIKRALPENVNLVIYVHNLPFEFTFLSGIYDFEIEDVFAIQRRKPVKCYMYNRFEFRCSYKLSNMSLKAFTHKFHVKHEKLQDYDYNIPLFSWSELTIEQLRYCQNDVLGLVESIHAQLFHEKDDLITIPLTSTGYVRREAKKVIYENLGYNFAKPFFPSLKLYQYMKKAFRGGDTHCNRWYCDETLYNVNSYDRSSSYPDVLCNCEYPITPFTEIPENLTLDYIEKLIFQRNRALIFEITFNNIRLRDKYYGDPYLTVDKSYKIKSEIVFTGRIISAETLTATITEVDYQIIKNVYAWDSCTIGTCFKASKGMLPQCFKEFIIDFYRQKTELKDLKGDTPEETVYNKLLYDKAKNRLNSIYGMCATDPIREAIEYLKIDKDFHYDEHTPKAEIFEKAEKGYWLPYEWGIYTTAYARLRLYEGINLVYSNRNKGKGKFSDFVYCDTDSVKYIGTADWTAYNAKRIHDSKENGAYATDKNGNIHYMGVYEQEKSYDKFRSCGSKKYAYEQGGKLSVTIAGVNKKKGAEELTKYGIDSLHDGLYSGRRADLRQNTTMC